MDRGRSGLKPLTWVESDFLLGVELVLVGWRAALVKAPGLSMCP